jgi:hemolysin D
MADPAGKPPGAIQPWSFSNTVLLRKTKRPSSALIWILASATGLVGVWALLAPLPETIAVEGKLQPSSAVKPIEAPVPGVVSTVLVTDGQAVAAGTPLIRFDQRDAQAKLQAASAIRARLVNENAIYHAILGELPATGLTANQRQQLNSQRQQVQGENRAASEELARSRTRVQGLRQSLATAESIAQRFRSLTSSGAASQLQLLEAQAKVDQLRSDLAAEQRDVARLQAQASATISGNAAELRSKIEANLRQIADLDQQISQARVLLSNITLTAPTAGVVFDVSVGPGSVVLGKQEKPLLKIVPQNNLQAKVYVPNSAIGFLRPGQSAQISLTAFPSSDYGRLPAKVLRIGSDALTAEEQATVLGTSATGLYFPAILQLERQTLEAGRAAVPLQAGMSLTADLHLRDRRFISVITGLLEDQRRGLERMR